MIKSFRNGFLGTFYSKAYRDIKSQFTNLYELYDDLNRFCHDVLEKVKPHRNNNQEIILCIIFIKVMTIFQGICLLTKKGMVNEAQILLRSMLEAIFIASAIGKDNDFIERYILSEEYERNRLYKKIDGNPEWKKIIPENIDERIAKLESFIKEKNIKKLTLKDIAGKSGLFELYDPIYSLLSKNVHATPDNIREYFKIDEGGDIEKILYGPADREIERTLNASMHVMINSLEVINEVFKLKITKTLDDFKIRRMNLK